MQIPLKQYRDLLVHYLKPQWPKVLWLAVLLLSGIALQLLNPQILRSFIDTATSGSAPETLTVLALVFVGVALVQQIVSAIATYVSENVGWTATNLLRTDLLAHCLRLDMSFHKARRPGEIIERIDGDVNALSNFFSQFVINIVSNVILLVGVLILLFREDWRAGLGLALFAFIALFILVRIRSFAIPYWTAVRQASANFFGFLGEQLSGTEDTRSSGATGYVMRRFYELLRSWLPVQRKAGLAGSAMAMTSIAVFTMGNAVAFALGAYLWNTGTITIGTVFLIFTYTELLRRPIEQIRTQMQDLQRASASIGRVEELFRIQSKIVDVAGEGVSLPAGALAVSFTNVSFSYEANEPVLREISFELQPGQALGLLGRTGSGKTTLARLLLRLYDPTSGEIRLGSVAMPTTRLSQLRQRVGMVTQDVQLFHATVRDNLTFFDRSIPNERILEVLQDLGLYPWYRSLAKGLDTELESGSGGLSAGEAQLLALARVFLKDPGLVILDEASSRLDPATEQLIERAIDKLLRDRTGIIIAHRLGTVQRADSILILESGRILEQGNRKQLANDPSSRFARLLQSGLEEVLA